MQRRSFLAALAAAPSPSVTVLVRSGWQTVNIGDIAHTPGLLALLEKHWPDARVLLWPNALDLGARPMLERRFPKVQIVDRVIPEADLLIHGSAAGPTSHPAMEAFIQAAPGKPYGYFGVGLTLQGEAAANGLTPQVRKLLEGARFFFNRETDSLANVAKAVIKGPATGFAPDATFSFDLADEPRALEYLKTHALEPSKFICVIPRLRYTPYHKIRKVEWTPEEIARRESVNGKAAEPDHAKLREAAIAYVRKTGGKVLFCPEMTYQLDIIDPLLYQPLPEDVKKNCVARKSYWLPDEAASVYARAAAVISAECHSPILAATRGTPCIYTHQPEDGIKGQMWNDVGLGDWYFQLATASGASIATRLLEITGNPAAARRKVKAAVARAQKIQKDRILQVRRLAG
jgi:hypothetical protein